MKLRLTSKTVRVQNRTEINGYPKPKKINFFIKKNFKKIFYNFVTNFWMIIVNKNICSLILYIYSIIQMPAAGEASEFLVIFSRKFIKLKFKKRKKCPPQAKLANF